MEAKTELQRNAIADARRKELETFQRALDIQWLNNRMEDGRMGRCLALIQKEAEMEKDYQERTDHAAIVNAKAKKETQLGIEIANIRREEACKLLRRHYLRERDPGLRELAKKLQAGYVCRDLKQQILHNEYRRLQEKQEEKHANNVLINALYNDKEAKEFEEKQKMERTSSYCRDLQQQLVNRERERQCAYEETLIEKKMLEEIMRTIADEDHRELEQKRVLMERSRNEMMTFAKAREAWKQKQKQMVVIEEKQIEEQQKAAADRSSAIVAERERKMRAKEELNEKICAKIMADQATRQERENIIKMLQEQEYLEKNVNDDIAEKNKLERTKRETKEALTAQMQNRIRLEQEQKRRELEFRKQSEAKMAAENEREREKEMKKREKGLAYSQELNKQIAQNARRRQTENKQEAGRARAVWDYYKDCVAERERKMRAKEELNEKICAKIMADQAARQERENIIKMLQEQEYLEKNVNDDIAEKNKLERTKRETKEALTAQMQNRIRLEQEQKRRELEFRKQSEAKMAAENEREREKEMKKREKGLAYSQELNRQIAENARRRQTENKQEAGRARAVWDYYKDWNKEVSHERKKIVEEHAPHLLGYLQAGVLKKDDLPAVIEGANKHEQLKSLDIKSMAISNRPTRFSKCNAQCRVLREY